MVYLDYAATDPVVRFSSSSYGKHLNPNAGYADSERRLLEQCEARIKAAIGVDSGIVLYFRCATEAIEWLHAAATRRTAYGHWAHSFYEHDCCLFGNALESEGVFPGGGFYIHQWVNHVTGEIFDLDTVRADLPRIYRLVVDATAGFGKAALPQALKEVASALFMSGHKIGCPELSFMWLSDELCEWFGATKDIRNQHSLHHGSLSVASVLALADAVETACDGANAECADRHALALYKLLLSQLSSNGIHGYAINGKIAEDRSDADEPANCSFAINAIRLYGINADALQQFLAARDIYVGIGGSSCSGTNDFRVLRACGLTDAEASEVIRVSFGRETTEADIEDLVKGILEYKTLFPTTNSSLASK